MKDKNNELTLDRVLEGLDAVTRYNGLAEEVIRWKDLAEEYVIGGGSMKFTQISCPLDPNDSNEWWYQQLQVLWMICVVMFGEYGTSPRSGWIEDVEGFKDFIDRITTNYRSLSELEE